MAKILYIEDIQDNITLVEKIVSSRSDVCRAGLCSICPGRNGG